MPKTAQHRLFLAKVSLALTAELRRRPTDEELQRVLRVVESALTGLNVSPDPESPKNETTPGGSPC